MQCKVLCTVSLLKFGLVVRPGRPALALNHTLVPGTSTAMESACPAWRISGLISQCSSHRHTLALLVPNDGVNDRKVHIAFQKHNGAHNTYSSLHSVKGTRKPGVRVTGYL